MIERTEIEMQQISDYAKYRGRCKELSELEISKDPTLKLVRGIYYCPFWRVQQHWWCERPDGSILDTTKDQFPSKGNGIYEPIPEGSLVLPCEECGKEIEEKDFIIIGNHVVCSNSCAMRLVGL